jgi:hypothetical protein
MKSKEFVIYNSVLFLIDRYIYESDEMFYFRINYIHNNLKNKNIDELIGLSMIEMNKKFLQCEYS